MRGCVLGCGCENRCDVGMCIWGSVTT